MKIKITVNDISNKINNIIKTETIFDTTEEMFESDLGVSVYGIECLGFPFVTADVYNDAIDRYHEIKDTLKTNKYTTIYKTESPKMTISVLK